MQRKGAKKFQSVDALLRSPKAARARLRMATAAAKQKVRQKQVSPMAKSVGKTVALLRRDAQTCSYVPANGGAGIRAGATIGS